MRSHEEIVNILKGYSHDELMNRFSLSGLSFIDKMSKSSESIFNPNYISNDSIEGLTKDEKREIVSLFSEEDISKICDEPRDLGYGMISEILRSVPIGVLSDYIIKYKINALTVFSYDFSLVKPLINNGLLFDLLEPSEIEVLLLSCSDKEYLVGLISNQYAFGRLSERVKSSIVNEYFEHYDELYSSKIDRSLYKVISSKKIAELYQKYNPTKRKFMAIIDDSTERAKNDNSDYANSVRKIDRGKLDDESFLRLNFFKNSKMPFIKLVSVLRELDVSDKERIYLLNRCCSETMESNKDKSFLEIASNVDDFCRDSVKNATLSKYGLEFMIPDYLDYEFDSELFKGVMLSKVVNFNDKNNTQIYFSQLLKLAEEKYGIKVERNLCGGRSVESYKMIKSLGGKSNIKGFNLGGYNKNNGFLYINYWQQLDKSSAFDVIYHTARDMATVFHEMRHARQEKMFREDTSVLGLALGLEDMLHKEYPDFYTENYSELIMEADARSYGYFEALHVIDEYESDDQAKEAFKSCFSVQDKNKFLHDRKISKVGTKEFINAFMRIFLFICDHVSTDTIKRYRENIPALKAVTDEDGSFYSEGEIIRLIEDNNDSKMYVFYTAYLNTLYGIGDALIESGKMDLDPTGSNYNPTSNDELIEMFEDEDKKNISQDKLSVYDSVKSFMEN